MCGSPCGVLQGLTQDELVKAFGKFGAGLSEVNECPPCCCCMVLMC